MFASSSVFAFPSVFGTSPMPSAPPPAISIPERSGTRSVEQIPAGLKACFAGIVCLIFSAGLALPIASFVMANNEAHVACVGQYAGIKYRTGSGWWYMAQRKSRSWALSPVYCAMYWLANSIPGYVDSCASVFPSRFRRLSRWPGS